MRVEYADIDNGPLAKSKERLIRLMTFNVLRNGNGGAGDRRRAIAAIIQQHDPDILCLQEGGDGAFWNKQARQGGYGHFQNIPGEFQPALLSRLPVKAIATHNRVKFVYFQLDLGAATLGVYSIHLLHWPQRDAERAARLNQLLAFIEAQRDPLVCVAGDFNSRSRGERGLEWAVEMIGAHNDCRIQDQDWMAATGIMTGRGYVDCYRRLHDEAGYSLHPLGHEAGAGEAAMPPAVRIDYVFANPALAERLSTCNLDESATALAASDHLPLVAVFETPV